jgi:ABC-type multidrug transport system fused ATPase/permease subunit
MKGRGWLVALFVCGAAFGCRQDGEGMNAPEALAPPPSEGMRGVSLRNFREGNTSWVLEADSASVFRDRKRVETEAVAIDFFEEDRHVSKLTARKGVLLQATDDLEARGDVRVATDDGAVLRTEVLSGPREGADLDGGTGGDPARRRRAEGDRAGSGSGPERRADQEVRARHGALESGAAAARGDGSMSAATAVQVTGLAGFGLVKSYRGHRVVDEVDLEVRRGEVVGLLGPNGAGKTTTFYMMTGLVRPKAERVAIDGEDDQPAVYVHTRPGRGLPART